MRAFRTLEDPGLPRGSVIALGNFDGLHRGHARIFAEARRVSRRIGAPILVFTFDPHPARVLRGERSIQLLQSTEQKLRTFDVWGFENVLLFPFTRDFSRTSPAEFMEKILQERLQSAAVVVGTLFRFGHDRTGDTETLRKFGERYRVPIVGVPPLLHKGEVVSSTWIRNCIVRGDLDGAADLLGRPYSLDGRVIRGAGRGAELVFPTANLEVRDGALPPSGVYVTLCRTDSGLWPAMTNVGRRPTFGGDQMLIESHLLGFDADLYGRSIDVFFLRRIRDEIAFPSVDALREQLRVDQSTARSWFLERPVETIPIVTELPPVAISSDGSAF